jgi:hypothetical protein
MLPLSQGRTKNKPDINPTVGMQKLLQLSQTAANAASSSEGKDGQSSSTQNAPATETKAVRVMSLKVWFFFFFVARLAH